MLRERAIGLVALLLLLLASACAGPGGPTLAQLHDVEPDVEEVLVENSLDEAMLGYRKFLEEAPESALTPEAMRRLADLKLEKEYGILGDGAPRELPAPEAGATGAERAASPAAQAAAIAPGPGSESEQAFERRAAGVAAIAATPRTGEAELPGRVGSEASGPLEAIALYDQILATYPHYRHADQVLYQKARALDELGRNDEAIEVIESLVGNFPHSRYIDEVQFRRAEYFFTRKKYLDAEESYSAVTVLGPSSQYYELALYKLGWTFYKQQLHEEALDQYVALLDYKVSTGYDFEQTEDEADERRIADTYRVISLAFSNIGGPEAVDAFFRTKGERSYEDRVYSHLGEFYLEKLRYNDAAASYKAFVALHPLHESAPHFSMRVVEIYEAGAFPKLVLESKKAFAGTYGLQSEYWRHFDVEDSPDVLDYLKANLEDLANHYHALYQNEELAEEKPANFAEASQWYRAYLESFPEDEQAPSIHYQLADLLLENQNFGEAARAYERTAYGYPEHERAAAAGYAAIFAHREHQKAVENEGELAVRRDAVASTLRFVDAFPKHEHAAVVLGAAADDLYDMKEFARAIDAGRKLIETYPQAELPVLRSAWAVVAHSSFDTSDYVPAEHAYARVLELTGEDDEDRQKVVDNLAAAIYKQGEEANERDEHREAADHFLRITQVAPGSAIRPAAEYDAGAALIRLEDWSAAVGVLDAFRQTHPEHELQREATRQIARIRRKQGDLAQAAGEYERVAGEAEKPELRREALLLAGELYEEAQLGGRALIVYRAYVERFPKPLELAIETRSKIAALHEAARDETERRAELQRIVDLDSSAGSERTERIRYLAAQAALVLSTGLYDRFESVELVQPFARSLAEKKRRMDTALDAFGALVVYEVGEVTAAATFYMAEIYFEFSRSLLGSERPTDLAGAEVQDYEMVLEEEAFPFEERAIAVHEKNLELMSAGVYNAWIEKSLAKLAEHMPGRYAKFEASSGWLHSLDGYAYTAPSQPTPDLAATAEDAGAPDLPVAEATGEAAPVPVAEPDADDETRMASEADPEERAAPPARVE